MSTIEIRDTQTTKHNQNHDKRLLNFTLSVLTNLYLNNVTSIILAIVHNRNLSPQTNKANIAVERQENTLNFTLSVLTNLYLNNVTSIVLAIVNNRNLKQLKNKKTKSH